MPQPPRDRCPSCQTPLKLIESTNICQHCFHDISDNQPYTIVQCKTQVPIPDTEHTDLWAPVQYQRFQILTFDRLFLNYTTSSVPTLPPTVPRAPKPRHNHQLPKCGSYKSDQITWTCHNDGCKERNPVTEHRCRCGTTHARDCGTLPHARVHWICRCEKTWTYKILRCPSAAPTTKEPRDVGPGKSAPPPTKPG